MNINKLKTALVLVAALITAPSFAGEALYDPATRSTEIVLAAVGIENEAAVQFEKNCESEKVGDSICVLCEYTAIEETSFNCYKIPSSGGSKSGVKGLKSAD
jgi:hypothetical protein